MNSALRWIYEHAVLRYGLGLLAVLCLIWTPFALVLTLVLPRRVGKPLGRLVIMVGFRFYIWALRLFGAFRFDLRELDRLRKQGPMIIAPNHPSLLDAVMILSRLPNVTCVLKASLIDSPLFGAGARLAGYIRNDSLMGTAMGAVQALEGGSHVLLFPEGTRTVHPPINPLSGSLVVIARRAKVPIQPIFIETESRFLGKGWPLFRRPTLPISYRIRLGERLTADDEPTPNVVAHLERHFAEELSGRTMTEPVT